MQCHLLVKTAQLKFCLLELHGIFFSEYFQSMVGWIQHSYVTFSLYQQVSDSLCQAIIWVDALFISLNPWHSALVSPPLVDHSTGTNIYFAWPLLMALRLKHWERNEMKGKWREEEEERKRSSSLSMHLHLYVCAYIWNHFSSYLST